MGGRWGVDVQERCLPNLGEDTFISSRSRRTMVVFLAFLRPSSLYFRVSTSTSNCIYTYMAYRVTYIRHVSYVHVHKYNDMLYK